MKKVLKLVGPFVLVLLVLAVLTRLCRTREEFLGITEPENPRQIAEEIYTPPIVNIPFITKDKQPVPTKDLPIPKEKVERSIHIDLTTIPQGRELVLIQDKRGNLYFPTETQEGVKVRVVKWQKKPISFGLYFGYSAIYNGDWAHCVSLDFVRVKRFYLGPDVGLANQGKKLVAGFSLKWHTFDLIEPGTGTTLRLSLLTGYDLIGHTAYAGINLKW